MPFIVVGCARRVVVDAAVDLDNELFFWAVEVDNESADAMLSPEFSSGDLTPP